LLYCDRKCPPVAPYNPAIAKARKAISQHPRMIQQVYCCYILCVIHLSVSSTAPTCRVIFDSYTYVGAFSIIGCFSRRIEIDGCPNSKKTSVRNVHHCETKMENITSIPDGEQGVKNENVVLLP